MLLSNHNINVFSCISKRNTRANIVREVISIVQSSSATIGKSKSHMSCHCEPTYTRPRPKIVPEFRQMDLDSTCLLSRVNAMSASVHIRQSRMPVARKAPDRTVMARPLRQTCTYVQSILGCAHDSDRTE